MGKLSADFSLSSRLPAGFLCSFILYRIFPVFKQRTKNFLKFFVRCFHPFRVCYFAPQIMRKIMRTIL